MGFLGVSVKIDTSERYSFLMSRYRLFFLALLICVGLGPAAAQDVFINRGKSESASSGKSRVFINRYEGVRDSDKRTYQFKTRTKRQGFARDKLVFGRDAKDINGKVAVFKAWQKAGRRPETMEEIRSYAASKRAVHEANMLSRRKELIVALEKRKKARDLQLAKRELMERARGRSLSVRSAASLGSGGGVSNGKTSRITVRKPAVFVKPADRDADQPSRGVFKNYR